MKVAVQSVAPTLGKTTLCSLLGGIFARSQGKVVCILSTGIIQDYFDLIEVKVSNKDNANPHVFRAILNNSEANDRTLLDWGERQGADNVFIYDIMNSVMSQQDKEDFFIEALHKMPCDLLLIEIANSTPEHFKKRVMDEVDCSLVLFDQTRKSFRMIREYIEDLPDNKVNATAGVIFRYNREVISEKNLTRFVGLPRNRLLVFPDNQQIRKSSINQSLDVIPYDIIVGKPQVLDLRQRMQEMMMFLFDTTTRRVIRPIEKWYRD